MVVRESERKKGRGKKEKEITRSGSYPYDLISLMKLQIQPLKGPGFNI
jgi:hypothetical protein